MALHTLGQLGRDLSCSYHVCHDQYLNVRADEGVGNGRSLDGPENDRGFLHCKDGSNHDKYIAHDDVRLKDTVRGEGEKREIGDHVWHRQERFAGDDSGTDKVLHEDGNEEEDPVRANGETDEALHDGRLSGNRARQAKTNLAQAAPRQALAP